MIVLLSLYYVCLLTFYVQGQASFERLPQQRRLDSVDKDRVVKMLSVGGNKKLVQAHVEQTTGKKVLLRDLHNLSATLRRSDDINDLIEQLQGEQGICATICCGCISIPLSTLYNYSTKNSCT